MAGKRSAQRRHARRRAAERYGINLGDHTHRLIVKAIQQGHSTPVRRSSLRATVHDVSLEDGGRPVRVVYDNRRKVIVTFLPLGEAS